MGQNNSKRSTGSAYRQLPSSKSSLTVHFYGIQPFDTEPLTIALETPISCEQVLIQCAEHLSQNLGRYFKQDREKRIGPLLLPLFGLYAKEHSSLLWVADRHVFSSGHAHQEFYFRIKVQLSEKIPQGVFADYLFWQTRDPSKVLQTPLKDSTKLEYILDKVKYWTMLRHFPEQMTPELKREYNIRKDWFLRFISYRFLRKYIRQFYEVNGGRNLQNLRGWFVETLMKTYVQSYGQQVFEAEKLESRDGNVRPLPVKVIVRPFQDGCVPGFYFNTKLVSSLQDIISVEIPESESSSSEQKCSVRLEFQKQTMVLQLASRELAQSFVSVLDLYHRLKVNYLGSPLNKHERSPSLRALNMLHSYGPMQEGEARDHLRRRQENQQCPDVQQCLIYQDCQEFGLLHVLATKAGSNTFTSYHIRFSPAQSESGFEFSVHRSAETKDALTRTTDPSQVIMYLKKNVPIGQCIKPKEDERCGAMDLMKDDIDYAYYSDVSESRHRKTHNQSDGPRLYREDQVIFTGAELLKCGKFSRVYRIVQVAEEREAIVKKVTDENPAVQEAHRKGAERLWMLQERCHFFIQVYGFMVSSPLRIVLESMPQGNGTLLDRLQNSDGPPFTWLHVSSVLKQLAQCLSFLAKSGMIYGSFCCAKILILEEGTDGSLTIRLGDPSRNMYLDTLHTQSQQNAQRLGWVAPERFVDLRKHSVASEVYAVGTTLWEMVTLGREPNSCLPAHTSAAQFFGGKQKLPTDCLGSPAPRAEMTPVPPAPRAEMTPVPPAPYAEMTPVPPAPRAEMTPVPPAPRVEMTPVPPAPCAEMTPVPPAPRAEMTPVPPAPHAEMTPVPPAPRAEMTPVPPAPCAEMTPVPPAPRAEMTPVPPAPRAEMTPVPPAPPAEMTPGLSRVQDWMNSTDLEQQAKEDIQQAGEDTQQAREDTQETGDVEEYVTGANAAEGGQTTSERNSAGEERGATAEENVLLQTLKTTVRTLIEDCWHEDPDQRPSPTDFHQRALTVRKQVADATRADVDWQRSLILEQALLTGETKDMSKTRRLKEQLQAHLQVQRTSVIQQQERQRVQELEAEVRTTIDSIILAELLDFTDSKELGKGHFGTVKTALLSPASETQQEEGTLQKVMVAVKMLNSKNDKSDELALFLKEALCICRLEHPNVVKMMGIVLCGRNNPYQLVLEYAERGSMESYVDKNSGRLGMLEFKLTLKNLSIDVAKGMEYVCEKESKIHGDLAARNVLLFSTEGRRSTVAKLCDFGLSRQLKDGYYDLRKSKTRCNLPAYLLPPESLKGWAHSEIKFTLQTDIWSYGLFLWEIFSNTKPDKLLGTLPAKIYEKYSKEHYRLPKPTYCSVKMYEIMMSCWDDAPEQRPLFSKLVEMISDLTDSEM